MPHLYVPVSKGGGREARGAGGMHFEVLPNQPACELTSLNNPEAHQYSTWCFPPGVA